MSRWIAAALSILSASGCSIAPSQTAVATQLPPIPPSLTERCPDLTTLQGPEMQRVAVKLVEVSALYYQCQARHGALSEAVRNREMKGD